MSDDVAEGPGRPGEVAFLDGALVPVGQVLVSAFDRTLVYGLGAFETLRLHGGRPFLLERHLTRLGRSLAALELEVPAAVGELPEGLVALAGANDLPMALCRITVTAGPDPAAGPAGHGPRVIARLRPAPTPPAPGTVAVGVAPYARDPRSPLAGVKSTSYLVHYVLRERAEREGRLDDLLLDQEGHVTEGTVSNLFVVRGGQLLTPPLSEGILAGVTRSVVLQLAQELGLEAREHALRRDDLARVDEAFLTGAGKLLVAVDVLDGRPLPAARPVTSRLKEALARTIADHCGVARERVRF